MFVHWQGIKLVVGKKDDKWRDQHAGEAEEVWMWKQRIESKMNGCKKLKKKMRMLVGSRKQWLLKRALCLCGLIASLSLFEVLTASMSGCQPVVVCVYIRG